MWRALFLAIGAFAVICGAECLVIDKAVFKARYEAAPGVMRSAGDMGRRKEFVPPDWAPWSLMASGAVTMLYSFTIPRRVNN